MHLTHNQRRRRERALVVRGIAPADAGAIVEAEVDVLRCLTHAAREAATGDASDAVAIRHAVDRLQVAITDALLPIAARRRKRPEVVKALRSLQGAEAAP